MNEAIKESHELQKLVQTLPKDIDDLRMFHLYGGKWFIEYNFREDSFLIFDDFKELKIDNARLHAFGISLRNYKFTDELCENIFNYIKQYEDHFKPKISSFRYFKNTTS